MDTTTPTAVEPDEFADAFAEFQSPAIPAPKVDDENIIDVDAKVVADPPAAAAATPAPAGDPPVVDPAAAPAAAVVPPVVDDNGGAAVPDRTTALETQIAELKAQLTGLKPAEAAPPPVAAPAPAAPVYTADEQATLTKYETDWPDIAAGEALKRRAEYREIVSYVFDQVNKSVAPALEFFQRQSGRTQYQDLVELVPDYDDVRDKTLAWIDTQPAMIKKAYHDVANNGTPADVAHLIDQFKKTTGYVSPAVATPAAAAAPVVPAAKALPPAAAAAVAALRVVKSGRSEPVQTADPDDFDSAFAEFSKVK